jgi:hypothetical protein
MINVAHSSISEWDMAPDKVDDCERQILDYKQALLVIAADRVCDLDLNGIDESPVEANGESPIHGTVLGRPGVYRGDAVLKDRLWRHASAFTASRREQPMKPVLHEDAGSIKSGTQAPAIVSAQIDIRGVALAECGRAQFPVPF